MFGNSINHLTTFKYWHSEPELRHIGHSETETGHFFAAERCIKPVFETLEAISDIDRFNYVWKQPKSPNHPLMWTFWTIYWPFRRWMAHFLVGWRCVKPNFDSLWFGNSLSHLNKLVKHKPTNYPKPHHFPAQIRALIHGMIGGFMRKS